MEPGTQTLRSAPYTRSAARVVEGLPQRDGEAREETGRDQYTLKLSVRAINASPITAIPAKSAGSRKTLGRPKNATPKPPAMPPNAEARAVELMKIADAVPT